MTVTFEVNKYDTETIEEIKASGLEIIETKSSESFDGTEVVAIVVALVPAVKEVILKLMEPKESKGVRTTINDEFGSTELVAKDIEELDRMVENYLRIADKIRKEKEARDGKES